MTTKEVILKQTVPILARNGYAGTSMRKVAEAAHREPSVIYTHFSDKAALLRETRLYIIQRLETGLRRMAELPARNYLHEMVAFELKNREYIVALLQYFMASKHDFAGGPDGYVPERSYAHMVQIIRRGLSEGIFFSHNVVADAKASTHLINGYLIEYYDRPMAADEQLRIVLEITDYIERSLMAERAAV